MIPDALYPSRAGTTDSEAIFLAMMGAGLDADPIGATTSILFKLSKMVNGSEHPDKFRFTSALTDGRDLYAFRFAENDKPNTLYYRQVADEVVVVSEPLDRSAYWSEVPPGHVLISKENELQLCPLSDGESPLERAQENSVVAGH
jgi:glutamine amidotransferase